MSAGRRSRSTTRQGHLGSNQPGRMTAGGGTSLVAGPEDPLQVTQEGDAPTLHLEAPIEDTRRGGSERNCARKASSARKHRTRSSWSRSDSTDGACSDHLGRRHTNMEARVWSMS